MKRYYMLKQPGYEGTDTIRVKQGEVREYTLQVPLEPNVKTEILPKKYPAEKEVIRLLLFIRQPNDCITCLPG